MLKGSIVGLIHTRLLNHSFSGVDDGRAVSLISTDTENASESAQMFHEIWAQLIEVVIGTAMLAYQVGWVCFIPLTIIFCTYGRTTRTGGLANDTFSLLSCQPILGAEPIHQAERMERSYSTTSCYSDLGAYIDEEFKDIGSNIIHILLRPEASSARAVRGNEGSVDDGRLQRKRYVSRSWNFSSQVLTCVVQRMRSESSRRF